MTWSLEFTITLTIGSRNAPDGAKLHNYSPEETDGCSPLASFAQGRRNTTVCQNCWAWEGDQTDDIINTTGDSSTNGEQYLSWQFFLKSMINGTCLQTEKSWQSLVIVDYFFTDALSAGEK